jgi:hypothetical protein
MSSASPITIASDPRFLLARKLITSGSPESAIDIFANLLERCRDTLGEENLNSVLCQYEYGNALFRSVLHQTDEPAEELDETEDDRKPAAKSDGERQREVIAAAAEKRVTTATNTELSNKRTKLEVRSEETSESNEKDDDVSLALEMIETALHILLASVAATSQEHSNESKLSREELEWALNQIPRFLICLGDVYAFREEHGNAVDAYIRALSYREDKWKEMKEGKGSFTIEQLQCRRLYIEACVLVAEGLLACPDGKDVICDGDDETVTYAKAADRIDFALSWFEVARRELDDLCK